MRYPVEHAGFGQRALSCLHAAGEAICSTIGVKVGSAARIGVVALIRRFGSTLNDHVHFHCVVIEAADRAGRERLLRYDRRKSPGGI